MNLALDYINETESAAIKLFEGVEEYVSLLTKFKVPMHFGDHKGEDEFWKSFRAWRNLPEVIEAQRKADECRDEYFSKRFSLNVLLGSILQIAAKGIELYSKNRQVAKGFENYTNEKIKKFMIGNEVRGVPMGLIIYAGRNQYNHLEAGAELHPVNKEVFSRLAKNHEYGEGIIDPAFDLENPDLFCYSSNVAAILKWKNYQNYKTTMLSLLCGKSGTHPN